jgi:predicted amidohydrolase
MVPVIGDVEANLEAALRLGDEAGAAGAEWIVLPEFFTTGIACDPSRAAAAGAPGGAALDVLRDLATRHGATVGGSFLCRDADGEARNAFLLVGPDGTVAGRHDKDLPTMWENAFYVGGSDDGILDAGDVQAGVALCWELMRTQTVRRLRGRVDLVVGGSGWWSIPEWPPSGLFAAIERRNAQTAAKVAAAFAPLVGAPVVHAAHAGPIECAMPWTPVLRYRGVLQGGATIVDAHGRTLAHRAREEGEGIVVADVEPGRVTPAAEVPDGFWLHRRGAMAAAVWSYQRVHGRRWYREHTAGRPPLQARSPVGAAQA